MRQERRYRIYCMNNKSYDADEEDMAKLKANMGEMLVVLKQFAIHPASISVIEPYFKEWHQPAVKKEDGSGYYLGEPQAPYPIQDLFNDDKLLKLEDGNGKK